MGVMCIRLNKRQPFSTAHVTKSNSVGLHRDNRAPLIYTIVKVATLTTKVNNIQFYFV